MHSAITLLVFTLALPSLAFAGQQTSAGQLPDVGSLSTAQRPASDNPQQWIVTEGDSILSMATAMYPHDHSARNLFISRVLRANPEVLRGGYNAHTPLPAGTVLSVPSLADLVPVAALPRSRPALAAPQVPPPAETAPVSPPPVQPVATPASTVDQLIIDRGERDRLAEGLLGGATPASHVDREAALLAAIDRNIDMQLELLERIERLEQVHANMRRLVEALDAQERILQPVRANPPIVETSEPPLSDTHESAPVAVLTPPASDDSTLSRMLPENLTRTGAIVASLFLLALLILQRYKKQRRSRLDDDAAPDTEPATATEQPGKQAGSRTTHTAGTHSQPEATRNRAIDATQSILDFEVSRAPDQFFEPVKRKTQDKQGSDRQDKGRQASSASHAATTLAPNVDPATIINHNEDDEDLSAVELADVMISFGRVDGAAEALEAFVENNPKKAVKPWLKLTEVYYKAGKRDEFETVAANLHRTFNVQTLNWAQYAQSTPLPGLEAMPHIVERLTAIWASPECQFYIDSLIRDNRQGTRGGFDLETLDDLLMLADILDVQLGRYRSNPE